MILMEEQRRQMAMVAREAAKETLDAATEISNHLAVIESYEEARREGSDPLQRELEEQLAADREEEEAFVPPLPSPREPFPKKAAIEVWKWALKLCEL